MGVTNRKKLDEFSVSCLDEYHMGIENSDSEVKALKKALDSLDEVLAPNLTEIVPLPHKFPLYVRIIVFAFSFVFSLVGQLMWNALTLWQVVYPIMFVGAIGLLAYVLITCFLDFIIVGVLFASVLIICAQAFGYLYRYFAVFDYCHLDYNIPCFMFLDLYRHTDIPGYYEIERIGFLFDPTLIVSALFVIATTAINLVKRSKTRKILLSR